MPANTPSENELHAYVDGLLDDSEMDRIEEYLRVHPEEAERIHTWLLQNETLRDFAHGAPSEPEPEIERLERRLAERLSYKHAPRWRQAAVVSIAFVSGWLGHELLLPALTGPAYANEIVNAHILTSTDPEEVIPVSPARMQKLFARIGEVPHLPDLRSMGYMPIGAQLLPSDEGTVLHVAYRDDKGVTISYFLLHSPEDEEVPLHVLHRKGVTMAYWQHDHSRYAIAAPLDDEKVARIAHLVESAPDNF